MRNAKCAPLLRVVYVENITYFRVPGTSRLTLEFQFDIIQFTCNSFVGRKWQQRREQQENK